MKYFRGGLISLHCKRYQMWNRWREVPVTQSKSLQEDDSNNNTNYCDSFYVKLTM